MNRLRGDRRDRLQVNVARVKVPLSAIIGAWVGRKIGHGLVWLLRHPSIWITVVGVFLTVRLADALGPGPVVGLMAAVTTTLIAWRHYSPDGFARQVTWRVAGLWRGRFVYRFGWQPAMVTTGLAVRVDSREYLPKIRAVASSGSVDRLRVRMLPGQTMEDWAGVAPRLAQTFNAQECRVRSVGTSHRELVLWFLIRDPLVQDVPAYDADPSPNLKGLPVARREDGLTYRLRLLGTHLLVVGATGSGKGSVIWSTIQALGPAIRDGIAQVWALDPKGGMELAPGRTLFTRFAYGDPKDDVGDAAEYELGFARLLEDAVVIMRRRQGALRGITRLHTPTVDEPLIVVVVDELASLTAYVHDRDAKKCITAALSLLLSQGRAVGVSVVGAVQDPRKEIVSMRDLFPTRVALRLTEPEQVGLVLGPGARGRGARCEQIPESLPGVGYVGIDGVAEPVRVRFSHITDDHIDALVRAYAPGPRLVPESGVAA